MHKNKAVPSLVLISSVLLTLSGCNDSDKDVNSNKYNASIVYTENSVPHISAEDYGSLGYGVGYVQADENLCTLSEQIVKLKGEKSTFFGAGEGFKNVLSDVGYKALDLTKEATQLFPQQPEYIQELIDGYVAGFNRSLEERSSPQNYPSPCRDADWVKPITNIDLMAYHLDLARLASGRNFLSAMAIAQPPQASVVSSKRLENDDSLLSQFIKKRSGVNKTKDLSPLIANTQLDSEFVLTSEGIGSNGWALGRDRVEGANSALLSNPHFPWQGELRFYAQHLTIPGELNINGVGMIGLPSVIIGHNDHLGWTHTVSQSKRFTLYQLELDPQNPLKYKYGDEYRDITSEKVTINIKQADGSLQPYSKEVFFSHFGPIVDLGTLSPSLGWNQVSAIAFRYANAGNDRMLSQWIDMAKANDTESFYKAFEDNQGIPWVNTLMVADDGSATYIDGSQTPMLSPMAEAYWSQASRSPQLAPIWQDGAGSMLLPGNNPAFEWVNTGNAGSDGNVPFANAPKLTRYDYLYNANSSHWLTNLENPLEGYSQIYGPENTIRSPRTRYNAQLISDMSGTGLAGSDNRFSFAELKEVLTHNGSLFASTLREQLVSRCTQYNQVNLNGQLYDLSEACTVLANWDGTYNLDSQGAHLMREFLANYLVKSHRSLSSDLFLTKFDPAQPIATPSELAEISDDILNDPVLVALASAASRLATFNIELDARLGDLQYVVKAEGAEPISVSGGYTFEGIFNMAEARFPSRSTSDLANVAIGNAIAGTSLTELDENGDGVKTQAYRVSHGASFVMALQFTDEGPEAEMFLTYGQSHDPESELFFKQTHQYKNNEWQEMLFSTEDIIENAKDSFQLQGN